ncbi:MAG: 30S ribosomal protein S13 [Patescibacteria group bacterium]
MPRIAGVNLPPKKRIEIGLTEITGIGRSLSRKILTDLGIGFDVHSDDLSESDVNKLRDYVAKFPTEGDLRRKVQLDIKRLQEINCYRGTRHRKRLPVRGQRTRKNARTRKGKKMTVANKKQVTK